MLLLKPNCECCDRDLPAETALAMICSFECTFCSDCAAKHFAGICPNCSGELTRRPARPAAKLSGFPAATARFVKAHKACGARAGMDAGSASL
ncbi:MAG: hypothetical protein B7Z78_00900 [Rhodospirillales bacterium 20-60-12]|nr:MAG: hypothetical protein B7Z78_00900 [Rhodospirillales bacterium 20-60-12]HQT67725.1 DUF1272 domain-containing protein [Acetobacteraceae bacterium]